jgi:mRNA-degrading endonuclease RelE of RelBE toxin-antitoxin system
MEGIPPRILPAIIEFAFGDLAREPRRVGKPLERDLAGLFSARRGPYRLLYRIDDDEKRVHIIQVDHRADVYRPH